MKVSFLFCAFLAHTHGKIWKLFPEHAYISENINVSSECSEQLNQYISDLSEGKEWAMKMFDARGEVSTGVLDGNVIDLGNFDECININEAFGNSTIYGKYCRGLYVFDFLKINSAIKLPKMRLKVPNTTIITLGTCFPSKCSTSEMENVHKKAGTNVLLNELVCHTKDHQPSMDSIALGTIALLGTLLGIVSVATICDLRNKTLHPILAAFSALQNGRKCMATPKNESSTHIACLNGIRVISTVMVICCHVPIYYCAKFDILAKVMKRSQNFLCKFRHNNNVAVDTFLLMSGLLVSFNEMKAISEKKQFNIVKHYTSRYFRLTPVLAVLVLYNISLIDHMSDGPLWDIVLTDKPCKTYWWSSLLYIQNYVNKESLCVTVSWYLSIDMQLFILSPILLIPLRRKPRTTMLFTGFLITFSIVASIIILWIYVFSKGDYLSYYSTMTHTRETPWLIGIVLGYLIFTSKPTVRPVSTSKEMTHSLFWILCLFVMVTCISVGDGLTLYSSKHRLATVLHLALLRPIWTAACAWVIYACVLQIGGPINRFLSLPIFEVLSKFTYSAYLVHWEIITLKELSVRTFSIGSVFEMLILFAGYLILTLIVAVVLTLLIEMPVITLVQLIFKKFSKSTTYL